MFEKVIDSVCEYFRVSKDELKIKRSKDKVSDARMFAIYILHCDYKVSISSLAREFDILRGSVFTIARKGRHRIALYPDDKASYDAIKSLIEN